MLNSGAYGAGAKVRLEYSSDGVSFTEDSTQTIVTGVFEYTFYHTVGTSSTYYRSRYSDTGGASFSDYSAIFQVVSTYTDLEQIKLMLKITDANDDAYLAQCAGAAHAWLVGEVGRFYGPSPDTSRTFDVAYPSGHRSWYGSLTWIPELPIAGGLRSFTKCEMKLTSADTSWIDVTVDVVARPLAWDRIEGMEADRLVFNDYPTLGYYGFYPGRAVARVTGVFGPAVPPRALCRIADTVAVWLYQSRAAGAGGMIGSPDMGQQINRVLTGADLSTIDLYRGVGPSMYAMPAF